MRNIYVISDTHFGHENFLKFRDDDGNLIRDFSCVQEVDELMVSNWNETVRDEDIVYHLGDVYFKQGWKHLERLKGRKRLVLGNHDKGKSPHLLRGFQKIFCSRMFPEFGIILTHHPIIIPENGKFSKNIHGHIHQNPCPTENHINVSVEAIDYRPVNIEEYAV